MNIILSLVLLVIFSVFLSSCNKGADPDELRAKSQAVGDIIQRSGTQIGDEKNALIDAQNRLRTGGGLFGKKGTSLDMFDNNNEKFTSVGFPINPALWRGSLEVVSFMPLASADPFGGIIITDWYSADTTSLNERCKLNIFIKGIELKSNNIKVNSFCQILSESGVWENKNVSLEDNIK